MAESSGELVSSVARSVIERRPSALSRMDKLFGLSVSSASVHSLSSDTTDINELDEEDVWAVETSEVGSSSGVDVRKGQTTPPIKIVSEERNGSGAGGLSDMGRVSRLSEKDSSPSGASGSARGMNGISAHSSRDNGPRSLTGRRVSQGGPSRRIPTVSRMIPRSVPQEDPARRVMLQSAPVNIPDWSKISRVNRQIKEEMEGSDHDREEEDEERLPPHEFLAKEYARSQTTAFSLLEGAGRTLKGRDLSRVRNAVLTQTGFLE